MIYKNYFKQLKSFSKELAHPLAQLYAFNLYTNTHEFSKEFYLKDLTESDYHEHLNTQLNVQYPKFFGPHFSKQIDLDTPQKEKSKLLIYVLTTLLSISLIFNFLLLKKKKTTSKKTILDYQKLLTKQELRVFEAMQKGFSNKEIADQLFISLSTVKTHINSIYNKLKISSRKEITSFSK